MRYFKWVLLAPLCMACTKTTAPADASNPQQQSAGGILLASPSSVDTLYELLQRYNPLAAQLQLEKARNQSLVTMLQSNLYVGCLSNVLIKTVEVDLDGEALAQITVTSAYKADEEKKGLKDDARWNAALAAQAVGTDPATGEAVGTINPIFTISLANGAQTKLTWSHDESTDSSKNPNPLFVIAADLKLTPTSTNVTIGEIDTFILKKNSVAYLHSVECEDGKQNCHAVSETQRFRMKKLRLLFNNIIVYDGTVEHIFSQYLDPSATHTAAAPQTTDNTSLTFSIPIKLNAAYQQAMQTPSCVGL